jgi:hypothetical protein
MTAKEARIATLETKIRVAESKGFGTSGCVTKWKRELRHLKTD